ncbi:MAG: hypothetical protein L3J19_01650 [Sulfurimonas sp.]|nr:hypothetical protein [Sulfurimonas sp.]
MTNTKIQLNKIVISVAVAMLLAILFIGCADKATGSSYDNNSAKWQQLKSKEAVENIDK